MNKFHSASQLERLKMESLLKKNKVEYYGFTSEFGYDQYDGWFVNSKGKKIIFEVKNRAVTSNRYPTTIIEEHKYDYLISQEMGEPWLFVFFTDDTYLSEHIKVENKYLKTRIGAPATEMGDQKMISKLVIEIPITNKNTRKI